MKKITEMKRIFNQFQTGLALLLLILTSCQNQKKNQTADEEFPSEMVDFEPHKSNSVFSGTNNGTWDNQIRERGYILFEDGIYKMWYSGYNGGDTIPKYLGYATSDDGINWKRYSVLRGCLKRVQPLFFVCKYFI